MSPVGGASGGGVGGNLGSAGTYGGFGGTYGFGAGGFGGTSSGGTFGFAGSSTCFAAGTQIATPSGTRPIEELRIGDLVLAYDELASRVVPRAVSATFAHPDQAVGEVPLSDGRVLRVTANHPLYLPDQRRYVDAGELAGNERLLTLSASAQTSSLIAGGFHASRTDPVTVYNITVAGEHNYFAEGVLVHNKTPAIPDGGCIPLSFYGECTPNLRCLNPERPTPEYVGLNQVVGARPTEDAGHANPADSGPTDSGAVQRTSADAGVEIPSRNAGATMCSGGSVPPNPSYLAFDVVNRLGAAPAVAIYGGGAGDTLCRGSQIGEISFQNISPPPPYSTTTQCILVPPRYLTQVTVAALNDGTEISNPRFVSGCSCVRGYLLRTTCGGEPGVSGACFPGFGPDGGKPDSGSTP